MQHLAYEIWFAILSFLPYDDLRFACRTNRLFCEIITELRFQALTINLNIADNIDEVRRLRRLSSSQLQYVKTLRLDSSASNIASLAPPFEHTGVSPTQSLDTLLAACALDQTNATRLMTKVMQHLTGVKSLSIIQSSTANIDRWSLGLGSLSMKGWSAYGQHLRELRLCIPMDLFRSVLVPNLTLPSLETLSVTLFTNTLRSKRDPLAYRLYRGVEDLLALFVNRHAVHLSSLEIAFDDIRYDLSAIYVRFVLFPRLSEIIYHFPDVPPAHQLPTLLFFERQAPSVKKLHLLTPPATPTEHNWLLSKLSKMNLGNLEELVLRLNPVTPPSSASWSLVGGPSQCGQTMDSPPPIYLPFFRTIAASAHLRTLRIVSPQLGHADVLTIFECLSNGGFTTSLQTLSLWVKVLTIPLLDTLLGHAQVSTKAAVRHPGLFKLHLSIDGFGGGFTVTGEPRQDHVGQFLFCKELVTRAYTTNSLRHITISQPNVTRPAECTAFALRSLEQAIPSLYTINGDLVVRDRLKRSRARHTEFTGADSEEFDQDIVSEDPLLRGPEIFYRPNNRHHGKSRVHAGYY